MRRSLLPSGSVSPKIDVPGWKSATGDQNWCFVGEPPKECQGWKLYISASNVNFGNTLGAVWPILVSRALTFKYVASERVLWKINAGLYGYSQIGKTIVVYLEDPAIGLSLLKELKRVLAPFAGTVILPPFANPVGGGLPLSYRYGAFVGETIAINGTEVADNRMRKAPRDGFPSDPFLAAIEPSRPNAEFEKFLLNYPVYEVLNQSAKGGVYASMDLSSPEFREVVLKVGRRNGNVFPDGRDAMDLVRQESWFYNLAIAEGLGHHIPHFDGIFEFPDAAAIVIERLEGASLQSMMQRDELELRHLTSALQILRRFHDRGLVVGDAKLANFIQTASGELKVIDFESGARIAEKATPDQHCTFMFVNHDLAGQPAVLELLHFLYSAVHEDAAQSFNEETRIIDLQSLIGTTSAKPGVSVSALELMKKVVAGTGSIDEP